MAIISVREVNKDTLDIVAKNGSEVGAYRLRNAEPRGIKGLIKRYRVLKAINAREKRIQRARKATRGTHTGCKGYKLDFRNSGLANMLRRTWRIADIGLMVASIVLSTYFIASWLNVVSTNISTDKAMATWNIFKIVIK